MAVQMTLGRGNVLYVRCIESGEQTGTCRAIANKLRVNDQPIILDHRLTKDMEHVLHIDRSKHDRKRATKVTNTFATVARTASRSLPGFICQVIHAPLPGQAVGHSPTSILPRDGQTIPQEMQAWLTELIVKGSSASLGGQEQRLCQQLADRMAESVTTLPVLIPFDDQLNIINSFPPINLNNLARARNVGKPSVRSSARSLFLLDDIDSSSIWAACGMNNHDQHLATVRRTGQRQHQRQPDPIQRQLFETTETPEEDSGWWQTLTLEPKENSMPCTRRIHHVIRDFKYNMRNLGCLYKFQHSDATIHVLWNAVKYPNYGEKLSTGAYGRCFEFLSWNSQVRSTEVRLWKQNWRIQQAGWSPGSALHVSTTGGG